MHYPRSFFAPEAVDAIHLVRIMHYRGTDQSINEYLAGFDPLRRKAESKMGICAGLPQQFISILRMSYAALPREEKSSVMASSYKSSKF